LHYNNNNIDYPISTIRSPFKPIPFTFSLFLTLPLNLTQFIRPSCTLLTLDLIILTIKESYQKWIEDLKKTKRNTVITPERIDRLEKGEQNRHQRRLIVVFFDCRLLKRNTAEKQFSGPSHCTVLVADQIEPPAYKQRKEKRRNRGHVPNAVVCRAEKETENTAVSTTTQRDD